MQTSQKTAFSSPLATVLDKAGIRINGTAPYDMQIHDHRTLGRILAQGTLGLGESYMDGWWDVPELDRLVYRLLSVGAESAIPKSVSLAVESVRARVFNLQSKTRSLEVGKTHYDLGNDLYRAMLDKRLVYTCAYWKDATTLDEAQEAKLDLVCRKLSLEPGMTVLDIGCGFGSFAKFAAERYGAHVTGITISERQLELGKILCKGLPVRLEFRDYRDISDSYDRIVSLGMFEHVGHKNYLTFMDTVHEHLKDDGLFLLHTIGSLDRPGADPWFSKYIFPNSELPSAGSISEAMQGLFVMEDWHNFGAYYDRTLMAWHANFERHWPELKSAYGERFRRMWRFYLLSAAGAFRARKNQLWQIVLSNNGVPGGYVSVR